MHDLRIALLFCFFVVALPTLANVIIRVLS